MKKVFIIISSIILLAFTNDKKAYQLFNNSGKTVQYSQLLDDIKSADIIFFGELHNNPICHWLQLELTKDLYHSNKNIVLGAEMFETDNQLILDEYVEGIIREKNFKDEAKLWSNYKTDYKPLVEFAKENKLKFVATNIPRRYASLVHKKGLEALQELNPEAKKFIAPLPIEYDPEVGCYKKMMQMMGGMGHKANPNLPKAQAIKDATMAWFIKENFEKGAKFIHYNGSFHSDFHEGIVWHLKKYAPKLKILTIGTVEQESIKELAEENKNQADYILAIPSAMTKTH